MNKKEAEQRPVWISETWWDRLNLKLPDIYDRKNFALASCTDLYQKAHMV
jgi:hypothetical protein